MARPKKQNADYFSHDADASSDEKIIYIESRFGLTGYAVYFKLLETMTRTDGFKLQWDDIKKSIYAAKFGIPIEMLDEIISECCREEVKAFVLENGLLFSPGLIKRLAPVLAKRERGQSRNLSGKKVSAEEKRVSATETGVSVTESTQSKVKESKVNPPIVPPEKIHAKDFDEFLIFWREYPKKIAKQEALDAWSRLNGTKPAISTIIEAIKKQKKSDQWTRDAGRYVPQPAKWLNNGQWDDDLDATPFSETSRYEEW